MKPFCDWLSVSSPFGEVDGIVASLQPILDMSRFSADAGGDALLLARSPGAGVVRVSRAGSVCVTSASGAALGDLRTAGQFADYLSALGSFPHRVTTLHATLDVVCDASPVVLDLFERGIAGHVSLSRKGLTISDINKHIYRRADGLDSGGVYLGGPRAQVRACVYDKQLERISKGCADPGPLTRFEMRVKGRLGATLRDAWEPERIFYHVASPDILAVPVGVAPWVPTEGGYDLPPRKEFLPAELMAMKIETSPDVKRLLALADECGPRGFDLLVDRLRELASSLPRVPRDPVTTPLVDAYRLRHVKLN